MLNIFPLVFQSFGFFLFFLFIAARCEKSFSNVPQGGHIKIHFHSDIPVQVDGEPWVQSPGDIVVLKSALKVILTQTVHNDFIIPSKTQNRMDVKLSFYLYATLSTLYMLIRRENAKLIPLSLSGN